MRFLVRSLHLLYSRVQSTDQPWFFRINTPRHTQNHHHHHPLYWILHTYPPPHHTIHHHQNHRGRGWLTLPEIGNHKHYHNSLELYPRKIVLQTRPKTVHHPHPHSSIARHRPQSHSDLVTLNPPHLDFPYHHSWHSVLPTPLHHHLPLLALYPLYELRYDLPHFQNSLDW